MKPRETKLYKEMTWDKFLELFSEDWQNDDDPIIVYQWLLDTGTELGGMHARIVEELLEEGLIEPAGEDHLDEEEVDYYEDEAALPEAPTSTKLDATNMYDESSWKTKKKEDGTIRIEKYLGNETSLVIPDGVSEIGESAFEGNNRLISVVIPIGVTRIEGYAFAGCSSLTSIGLPNGLKHIFCGAFYGCKNLNSVVVPDGVSLDVKVFRGCQNLTTVKLPSDLPKIEDDLFWGCKKMTSVVIPGSVRYIGVGAFKSCTSLVSVTLQQGIDQICQDAFRGCKNLTSITIPDGVTIIDVDSFEGCSSITSVTFPESMDQIWVGAFENCTGLESVVIHARARIYDNAFDGCPRLVIHAPRGSSAFDYAKANRIPFIEY